MTDAQRLEELEKFLHDMTKPLEGTFDETQKAENPQPLTTMWFLDSGAPEKPQLTMIATPWSDNYEKEAAVTYLKTKMKELNVYRYVQIAEVWTMVVDPKVHPDLPKSIRMGASIASHPERREAVIAIAEDKYGNTIHKKYFILRPEHGPAKLAPPETEIMPYNAEKQGLMTHLLEG